MRSAITYFILLTYTSAWGQIKSSDTFWQEMPTVFTPDHGLPQTNIRSILKTDDKRMIARADESDYLYNGKSWEAYNGRVPYEKIVAVKKQPKGAGKIHKVVRFNDRFAMGAENGLFISDDGKIWTKILPADSTYSWAPLNVKALTADDRGRLWFGTLQGAGVRDGNEWRLFTGKEGLPWNGFTCATRGTNGEVWFGTDKGVIRTDGDSFHYRMSRRWLPGDKVNDILVEDDGTAWVATDKGVARISFQKMTWEEKAALFTKQVEERHNRDGFVVQNKLQKRYDPSSFRYDISDNDGLYTSMYGAAQTFRYAVTKEQEARDLAVRTFRACKWLVDIEKHQEGFPARVIVPIDWPDPVNEIYDSAHDVRMQKRDPLWKIILPRFVESKDGKYLWKCDASMDELAGHYFFYGLFYDLVAETKEEKEAVQEVVRDITDHLIRNGFLLRDHDGEPTRWANFSPEFLNSVWGWDQRGLNSMMMLSFLNVAAHVTGDKKYEETAAMLREKHNYHIHAMVSKKFYPPRDVAPWDNNLCLMSLYGLLKYEKDPGLALMYQYSLLHSWLQVSLQQNPFWNLIYAALYERFEELAKTGVYTSGEVYPEIKSFPGMVAEDLLQWKYNPEDITGSLKILPLDLIGYSIDNSHRLDIIEDITPGVDVDHWRHFENPERERPKDGWHVNGKALPIDERGHVRQDRSGFYLRHSEGGGYSEHEGTFYLLPYYMARYYKIIE